MGKKEALLTFSEWLRLLSCLEDLVRHASRSDLNGLLAGSKRLEITGIEPSAPPGKAALKGDSGKVQLDDEETKNIAELVLASEDRQAAMLLLQQRLTQKVSAIKLARHLALPIAKNDSKDRILDKIVEGTIGYKLRSKAIQGE